MRITRVSVLWLSLVVGATAFPQRAPFHDDKIDSYGNLSFKDEKERLDWLAKVLGDVPDGLAYINVYAGRNSCIGEARARALRAKRYLIQRWGVRADRIIWRNGGFQEGLTVDLWVRPRGAPIPIVTPTVDPKEARISGKCKR